MKNIIKSALLPITQKFYLPQQLIFFVTSRCNARCDFCLYGEQVNNPVSRQDELTLSEITKLSKKYGKLFYLGISGGEPFIRTDLDQICQSFIDFCDVSVIDIPSNFYFTENLIDTTEKIVSRNPGVNLDLQLSLDHIGQKHDKSRNVKGLFDKAINTFLLLEQLRKKFKNLRLKINIVYLNENKKDLDFITEEINNMVNPDRIQITYPHTLLKGSISDSEHTNQVEHYIKKAEEIDSKYSKNELNDIYSLGLRALKKTYHQMLKEAVNGKKNTGSYCGAGKNIIVLNEKGDVFPCEPLWDQRIGNIRDSDYDIKKIVYGNNYKKFTKDFLGYNKCNCTYSCAINSGISTNYKYYPKLAIDAIKLYNAKK